MNTQAVPVSMHINIDKKLNTSNQGKLLLNREFPPETLRRNSSVDILRQRAELYNARAEAERETKQCDFLQHGGATAVGDHDPGKIKYQPKINNLLISK